MDELSLGGYRMALQIQYTTASGIDVISAHCIIRNAMVEKKITIQNDTVTKTLEVTYDGVIYSSASSYEKNESPLGGFGFSFEFDNASTKQQFNLIKQCYLNLKTQDGFTDGTDC